MSAEQWLGDQAAAPVKVYDVGSDELVPVTQKWCDDAARAMNVLATQRELVRWLIGLSPVHQQLTIAAMQAKARELGML